MVSRNAEQDPNTTIKEYSKRARAPENETGQQDSNSDTILSPTTVNVNVDEAHVIHRGLLKKRRVVDQTNAKQKGKTVDKLQIPESKSTVANIMIEGSNGKNSSSSDLELNSLGIHYSSYLDLLHDHDSANINDADPVVETARREFAASTIQRAWRYHCLADPIEKWKETGITVEKLRKLSFESTTQLIQTSDVTTKSATLLRMLQLTTPPDAMVELDNEANIYSSSSSSDDKQSDKVTNKPAHTSSLRSPTKHSPRCRNMGRVFITGFLFSAHMKDLASEKKQLDAAVESSASTMLKAYKQFEISFVRRLPDWYERQRVFMTGFRAFCLVFESWKRADSRELLSEMERCYLELDRLWQSVQRKTDARHNSDTFESQNEDWRIGIKSQRDGIMKRIKALAGDGAVNALLRKQAELRTTYSDPQASKTPSVPPSALPSDRVAHDSDNTDSNYVSGQQPSNAKDTDANSVEPDTLSVIVSKMISDPGSHEVDRVLGNFDLTASAALQNAKLAHEIVLDSEFRLKASTSSTTAFGNVQEVVTKAFFDHIEQEIKAGSTEPIEQILSKMRLELRTIIPPYGQSHETLETEFDSKWISAQLSNGALDVDSKFVVALKLMKTVCAPVHDNDIDSIESELTGRTPGCTSRAASNVEPAASQDSYRVHKMLLITRKILNLINTIRVDAITYQLQTVVRPWLLVHAVEYERAKFSESLDDARKVGGEPAAEAILKRVSCWLKTFSESANQDVSRTGPENSEGPSLEQTSKNHVRLNSRSSELKHAFLKALVSFCFDETPFSSEIAPPTLVLDIERIHKLQNEMQIIISGAALSTLYRGLVSAKAPTASTNDKSINDIGRELIEILRSDDVTIEKITNSLYSRLKAAASSATDDLPDVQSLDQLVKKTLVANHPMFSLLSKRLEGFLLSELGKEEPPNALDRRLKEDGDATHKALSSLGLGVACDDICRALLSLSRLAVFNWRVYSEWYLSL